MAPSWVGKAKSKLKGLKLDDSNPDRRSAYSAASIADSVPEVPSKPSSNSPRRTGKNATVEETPIADHPVPITNISTLPSLQERLWNQAYEAVKEKESRVAESYEAVLSTELRQESDAATQVNNIGQSADARRDQMQQLISLGKLRMDNATAAKSKIEDGMHIINAIRGPMDKAVKACPQAAVAWVGICFGLEILANPVSEAASQHRGLAHVVSRMEWYWSLASLLLEENRADGASTALSDVLEANIVKLFEAILLYQMKSVCLFRRSWITTIGRDLLLLDDWAETAVRKDAQVYNTEKIKLYLDGLASTAIAQEQRLGDIHSAIQEQTRQQEERHRDEKDEMCIRDLRETDPRDDKTRIESAKGGLLKDAYGWIIEHPSFKDFRDSTTKTSGQLLWIEGQPGKGKTMLICGIINELERMPDAQIAYFYCQATEAKLNSASSVLRGLIYSLVTKIPQLLRFVRERYDQAGKQLFEDGNAWEALTKILGGMLREPSLAGVILVVDALDECTRERERLIDFIVSTQSRVKWIVSSRGWPEIRERLHGASEGVRLRLEVNEQAVSEAVNAYIRHKMDGLSSRKKWTADMRKEMEQYLVENSHGTFLWVALVCAELEKAPKWRTRALMKLFPPGLNKLYGQMMTQIHGLEYADICKDLLAVMALAYRPLSLAEMKTLAEHLEEDYDDDDLQEIIGSCGSFLAVKDGVIYFVHQSAKDYLVDEAPDKIFPADSSVAGQHRAILLRSLTALQSDILHRDMYGLENPGFPMSQVRIPEPDPLGPVRYACIHWVNHLSEALDSLDGSELADGGPVDVFLRDQFLYWLEALALLKSIPAGFGALLKLETFVNPDFAPQLFALLRDARRFVPYFRFAIEAAPLQVYASALVFSPEGSIIKRLFSAEKPSWITTANQTDPNWDPNSHTLEGHTGVVRSIAFSPDSRTFASGSSDGTIMIWDASTGAHVRTVDGFVYSTPPSSSSRDKVCLTFAQEGSRLVFTGDGHLQVLDAQTWSNVGSIQLDENLREVSLSTKGDVLGATTTQGHLQLLVGLMGPGPPMLTWVLGPCTDFALSHDGQRAVSVSPDQVRIWDVITGTCLQTHQTPDMLSLPVLSPDGRYAAFRGGVKDGTLSVWDTQEMTWTSTEVSIACLAFSESNLLVMGGRLRNVEIRNVQTDCVFRQTVDSNFYIPSSVALSPNSRIVAVGYYNGLVRVWDTDQERAVKFTSAEATNKEPVQHDYAGAVFFPDGQRVLTKQSRAGRAEVWDTESGRHLLSLDQSDNMSLDYRAAFSLGGQWIVLVFVGDEAGDEGSPTEDTVFIWDTASGMRIQAITSYGDRVDGLALSSNGSRVAASLVEQGFIRVWDVSTGSHCYDVGSGGYYQLAYSSDSDLIAALSRSLSAEIYRGETLQPFLYNLPRDEPPSTLSFLADGKTLIINWVRELHIWDTDSGTHLQTLRTDSTTYFP